MCLPLWFGEFQGEKEDLRSGFTNKPHNGEFEIKHRILVIIFRETVFSVKLLSPQMSKICGFFVKNFPPKKLPSPFFLYSGPKRNPFRKAF